MTGDMTNWRDGADCAWFAHEITKLKNALPSYSRQLQGHTVADANISRPAAKNDFVQRAIETPLGRFLLLDTIAPKTMPVTIATSSAAGLPGSWRQPAQSISSCITRRAS